KPTDGRASADSSWGNCSAGRRRGVRTASSCNSSTATRPRNGSGRRWAFSRSRGSACIIWTARSREITTEYTEREEKEEDDMAAAAAAPESMETLADLVDRLGEIPLERIRLHPPPGEATEEDLIAALEAPRKRICELVDGVLVEKPMGTREAILGGM